MAADLGELSHVVLEGLCGVLSVGKVIDEDDLLEEVGGGPLEDGVDRPEEDGPGLVVEAHHHRRVRQIIVILLRQASGKSITDL